ncbi:MAG: preprotein translocase subunit SecA [Deltaproteobacteria bacterium]
MIGNAIRKIFGTANDRYIKSLQPLVERTNELEAGIKKLSDPELAAQTARFRERLERGESLDDLIPEIFATVREVAWRTVDMRHFDVQIVGGAVLNAGKIAEMKTGEGKTLVATLPLYANSLQGQGSHLVTVNDYLARRDAAWMGPVYNFLGLSVGVVTTDMDEDDRYKAYRSDITYGQNNEFGFDYLRDNMKFDVGEFVQGELAYGIVDEVDSILIDEARTPLIISGPAEDSTEKYYSINRIIPRLNAEADFTVDEKLKATTLTEEGVAHVEKILGIENLYDPDQIEILHHVNQALKAHALFRCDVDYMIDDGQVVIVDEFTGRLMPGRRWSDGLHQAVEAKEGVTIERENQTLATVTFQNYFRMYDKLSGMTGTADTEAEEFRKIYNLDVVVVPTNQDMLRQDFPDVVYRSEREKFEAVIEEIEELNERGQPVLVGTISIENSEKLSAMLKKTGVKHHVLNAKHHASEAEIVAQAGRKGAVTISTNMAGRGTDIVLGGNPTFLARDELGEGAEKDGVWESTYQRYVEQCEAERGEVIEAGGLHILGTERHESRRIDNQLRGRSGRQGDPGSSRFYMSLQDDLLRIFGAEKIDGLMGRLGMEEGVPIEAKMVSRAIESAQQKVEGHNFDIRKHLLEYDDVMNQQREIVYGRRREYLSGGDLKGSMVEMAQEAAAVMVANHAAADDDESYDWQGLDDALFGQFRLRLDLSDQQKGSLSTEALSELTTARVAEAYDHREVELGNEVLRHLERVVTLQSIDSHWKDHLLAMDHLKEGIGLRGYGQRNPLQEYQREGFDMFAAMLERFESDVLEKIYSVRVAAEEDVARMEERQRSEADRQVVFGHAGTGQAAGPEPVQQIKRSGDKVGRNDPCPCGSGKKYKKCHGR